MSRRKIPTQGDIRAAGRCGNGYRPSDGQHCGKPSEPGAAFGDCPGHARVFRVKVQEIDRADPAYQSAARIERGDRVLAAERFENRPAGETPSMRRHEVTQRASKAQAQRKPVRQRTGRSR